MSTVRASRARYSGHPRRAGRPPKRQRKTRIDWRDKSVWTAVVLLVALGFAMAYGWWWRTWRLDLAREQDWYVGVSLIKLRDFRGRVTAFIEQQNPGSLALLAASASRLDGTLAQIPRRGPVAWKAEIVGLGTDLRTRLESALSAQLLGADRPALTALAAVLPPVEKTLGDLEKALGSSVVRVDGVPTRLSLSPDAEGQLVKAIAAAREAVSKLPG